MDSYKGATFDHLVVYGGLGNDIYIVDNANDVIGESDTAGLDEIRTTINWTMSLLSVRMRFPVPLVNFVSRRRQENSVVKGDLDRYGFADFCMTIQSIAEVNASYFLLI